MPLTYKRYQEASKFWQEVSSRFDAFITYLQSPDYLELDEEFIHLMGRTLYSLKKLCDYRAEKFLEKAEALKILAGE